MNDLTIDEILAADDLHLTPVDVPEWGGRVYVRMLTAPDAIQFSDAAFKGGEVDVTASTLELVALCCTDAKGRRLFKSAAQVAAKSHAAVRRVHEAAARLNKLHKGADEEKKDSPEVPPAGSRSG